MIKSFYKLETARKFLRSNGISQDLEYMHLSLVNGRWMVQV